MRRQYQVTVINRHGNTFSLLWINTPKEKVNAVIRSYRESGYIVKLRKAA